MLLKYQTTIYGQHSSNLSSHIIQELGENKKLKKTLVPENCDKNYWAQQAT